MTEILIQDSIGVLQVMWLILSHYYGWVLFVLLGIVILYQLYLTEIQQQYVASIDWSYLEIKPPRENATSFYSMEQVFIQLHQLFDNWTFQEKYLEGKVVFWLSLEVVSLGGKISYVLRVPTKQRDLVEAALYANFPSLEITEIHDYLSQFEYDVDNKAYDMFACEFVLSGPQVFPIRTYKEFQSLKGPEVSEIVVDPLAPLLETFTKISAQEFYGLQILIRPVMDGSWKDEAKKAVEELRGDKEYTNLDEITKQKINSVQAKLGRPGFNTKIRIMHMGTKESFNKNAKKLILSPMKVFSTAISNGFKPAFAPKLDYKISPTLEAPYIDRFVRKRKILLFQGYKKRSTGIGENMYVLNTEELATLFHFPVSATLTHPAVESIQVKNVQPPANLPIG